MVHWVCYSPFHYAVRWWLNSDLPYPEGVAAAEILKAGNHADGDSGVKDIAYGWCFSGISCIFN